MSEPFWAVAGLGVLQVRDVGHRLPLAGLRHGGFPGVGGQVADLVPAVITVRGRGGRREQGQRERCCTEDAAENRPSGHVAAFAVGNRSCPSNDAGGWRLPRGAEDAGLLQQPPDLVAARHGVLRGDVVVVAPDDLPSTTGRQTGRVGQNAWFRSTGCIDGSWAAGRGDVPVAGAGADGHRDRALADPFGHRGEASSGRRSPA